MDQRDLNKLCDRMVRQFALPRTASYRDACHRVGEVLSELMDAQVELKFAAIRHAHLSGATALRADGTYVIYCAKTRSWYHRLVILLHEFAHLVLGHRPVTLNTREGMSYFAPNLPRNMARIIARRTVHSEEEERQAEEMADKLLERLTEQDVADEFASQVTAPHVLRIAEGLAHRSTRERHGND